MKLVVFGLPLSTHTRLKAESGDWADAIPEPHEFQSVPLDTNSIVSFTKQEIADLRRVVESGFTHIVIVGRSDWKMIQTEFRFDCRVHTISFPGSPRNVPWDFLKARLHEIVDLDDAWLRKISPTNLRHALLLPTTFFRTSKNTSEYWNKCDVYTPRRIPDAERVLQVVEREHRKPDGQGGRSWIDSRGWRYRFDPSRHGISASNREGRKAFRFCYEVLPGFHYDVVDDGGAWFSVDINGKPERLKHCNVTPWGLVRRG